MLIEEAERITPKDILKEEWMQQAPNYKRKMSEKIIERLVQFQSASRLRKTILSYLAARASDEEMKNEIDFFYQIDQNSDGYITLKELKKGLKDIEGSTEIDIEGIMKHIDTDNNGAINFNEFLAATLNNNISKDYERIAKAFKFFDRDNDGFIDDKELKQCLAGSEFKHIDTNIFADVVNECGSKNDGKIDFNEFLRLMSVKIEKSL